MKEAANGGYPYLQFFYKDIVREIFLENPHTAAVHLLPDPALAEKRAKLDALEHRDERLGELKARLAEADRVAHDLMGESALPDGVLDPVTRTMGLLKEKGLLMACAESCTGGMIANMMVERSGVSSCFAGGVVTYSNDLKEKLLGVPAEVLAAHGAVSCECACAMVRGAAEKLGADTAVATTGIAGPDGGTPEKPVGLVYIAAWVKGEILCRELRLRGGRTMIRQRAAAQALNLLNTMLEKI